MQVCQWMNELPLTNTRNKQAAKRFNRKLQFCVSTKPQQDSVECKQRQLFIPLISRVDHIFAQRITKFPCLFANAFWKPKKFELHVSRRGCRHDGYVSIWSSLFCCCAYYLSFRGIQMELIVNVFRPPAVVFFFAQLFWFWNWVLSAVSRCLT